MKLRRPRDDVRNHRSNPDDFDVVNGAGYIIGRILKPGGGTTHWMWTLSVVVTPPLRNQGFTETREQAQAAFREAWRQWLTLIVRRPNV